MRLSKMATDTRVSDLEKRHLDVHPAERTDETEEEVAAPLIQLHSPSLRLSVQEKFLGDHSLYQR